MSRTIVISDTEKHPLSPGIIRQGAEDSVVVLFGMHNNRGDNVIYSTRVTDKFYDVLSKYDLVFYKGDSQFLERMQGYRRFVRPGVTMDMVGVAYRIRKMWNSDKYLAFITEIADALEINDKDVKPVDVNVKPREEQPPNPEILPPPIDNQAA